MNFRDCRRPFYRSVTFSPFLRSALFIVLFLCAAFSSAAVYTWSGGAGDGNWSSAANWSPSVSGGPGASDTIQFTAAQSASVSLNGDVTVAGALIYNTTGTIAFNLNGYALSVGDGGTGTDSRFNLGSSTGGAAAQGARVVINGPGTVTARVFDSSQNADCSLTLSGGVAFSVSDTIYANGTAVTTVAGDSSCSFTLPATYDSSDDTNVIEFAGAMSVSSAAGTYTVSTSGTPAAGSTVTVQVSSTASFSELKYVFTVKNANSATAESYMIDGTSYTAGSTVPKSVSPSLSAGTYTYTFPIVFPVIMDSGDGLSFTVQDGSGTALGSLLFFAPAAGTSTTWTGAVNSDWSVSGNWTNGVPSNTVHTVTVPAVSGSAFPPVLDTAVASGVKKITVDSGAELSLNGQSSAGAVLINNGTVTLTGSETGIGSVTNGAGSTVVYTGVAAAPVWGGDYVNLTVASGAALTLDKNVSVSGALTNFSGAVFDMADKGVTVAGVLQNDGTVRLYGSQTVSAGTVTNGAGSTVEYYGGNPATATLGGSFAALKTSAGKVLDFTASAVTAETIEAAGDLTLTAASLTLSAGGTAAGDVSFMCDDFELGGSFSAGSRSVSIYPYTPGRTISLGTAAAGELSLTAAELNRITTAGTLTIGIGAMNGAINVTGAVSLSGVTGSVTVQNGSGGISVGYPFSAAGDLSLVSAGSISGTGKVSASGTGLLSVRATSGINLNTATGNSAARVTLENATSGNIVYYSGTDCTIAAENAASTGAVSITDVSGVLSVGDLSGVGGLVGIKAAGNISVTAAAGGTVTLASAVSSSASGSSVTFDCPLAVAAAVTVTAPAGTVAFTSSIDAAVSPTNSFTVVAGGGTVTFGGNVGSVRPLDGFAVTAASVNVGASAVFADVQTYTADVSVTTGTAATFTGSVTIGSGYTFTGGSMLTTFTGSVMNNGTITSGTGGITFGGSVTGGAVIGSVGVAVIVENATSAVFAPASFTHNGCLFELKGSGRLVMDGAYTFNTFTCVQAGKQIAFKAGEVQTVTGTFTVTGATGSPVSLESAVPGSLWFIDVVPANTTVTYAAISDSESYDVLVSRVANSTDFNTVNWFSAVYTWKGTADSNWNTRANWRVGTVSPRVPAEIPLSDNAECGIVIDDGGTGNPLVLSASNPAGGVSGVITLKSITVGAGSRFETHGRSVTARTVVNDGSVTVSGTETFSFTSLTNGATSTVTYRNAGVSVGPVWAANGTVSISYGNLTVQGSYTGGGDASDTTLQVGSNVITVDGALTNYGCIEINGTGSVSKTDSARGKFIYSAAAGSVSNYTDAAGAYDYYDLTVTAGTQTVSAPITAAGSVVNAAVFSLSAGGSVVAVGNVSSLGTLVTGGICAVSATGGGSSVTVAGLHMAAGSVLNLSAEGTITTGSFTSSGTGTLELSAPALNFSAPVSVDTLILAPANTAAATYTFSAKISASNVQLRQGGSGVPSFVLDNTGNTVLRLAADTVGAVTLVTTGALSCGGINASGAVTLAAGGAVTQSAPLECAELSVASGAGITLDNTANKIASLGAVSRGGAFTLADSEGGLIVSGTLGPASSGASVISIEISGGTLALNGTFTETGTVSLVNTGGAIMQTAPFTAGTLRFQAGGNVVLDNAANAFGSVGGVGANVTITDADGYTVAVPGIDAGGAVSLSSVSGNITLQQPVAASDGAAGYDITFGSPVILGADTEISSAGSVSSGNISFGSTIDAAASPTAAALTVKAGTGTVTLSGTVGAAVPLSALKITAGTAKLDGGAVSAETQTYESNVSVGPPGALQVTGTSLTLASGKSFSAGNGLLEFNIGVANGGIISAGSGGIRFSGDYSGAGGTLANDATGGIVFDNNTGNVLDVTVGTFVANGGSVTFSGSAGYRFTPGTSVYAALAFLNTTGVTLSSGSVLNANGSVSVGSGGIPAILDFSINGAGFIQSWPPAGTVPDLSVVNGTVTVGTGTFVCGNLTVALGAVFEQIGANTGDMAGLQSVQVMTNNGSLTWDSTAAGGFVTLNGTVSGAKASTVAFNKKNVTVAADVTLSGVFYDLTVPAGITVTNGAGIRVKRHFTINGQYTANAQILTLGGAGSEDGQIRDDGAVKSLLGSVVLDQGTAKKSFMTDIKAGQISISAGSGAVTFDGALEAAQFVNAGGTFDLSFNNAASGQTSSVAVALTVNTTGAVSFGNSSTDVFSVTGALSVPAATPPAAAGAVGTAGKISASDVTLDRSVLLSADTEFDVSGSGGQIRFGSTIDAAVPATVAALTVTAGTGSAVFNGAVGTTVRPLSLTIASAAGVSLNGGSIHTSGVQTYRGAVTLGVDTVVETTNGAVTFVGSSCTVNGAFNLSVTSGTAPLVFGGSVGAVAAPSGITASAGDTEVHAPLTTTGAFIVSHSGIFKSLDNADITVGGSIDLTATAPGSAYQFAGSVVSSGGAVHIGKPAASVPSPANPADVYLYTTSGGIAAIRFAAGAGNAVTFYGNLFAACSGKTVVFDSDIAVGRSFVTYGIEITFGSGSSGLTCAEDIVLLGTNYAEDDAASGVAGLFAYDNPLRGASGYAPVSLSSSVLFPGNLPDGTALSLLGDPAVSGASYTASVVFPAASLGGKTLSAGKNFYANGVGLEGSAAWTLAIPDNGKKSSAFAEAYNTSFKNCTVRNHSAGGLSAHAVVAAAENGTDSGSNSGIAFSRPYLRTDVGVGVPTDLSGTPNRSGTYTIYDDVVRVEFRDSTGNTVSIENSENEISAALAHIKFNGGSFSGQSGGQTVFSGAFTDADCTVSANGAGDLAVFYLQIADPAYRWNTDASGTSAGHADSTDRGRTGLPAAHRSAVPNLDIPKALAGVYATLLDENKNRIAHYSGLPVKTDGSEGGIFGAVTDRCAPVLVSVRTGQELHESETATVPATVPNQRPYDAHNFMEFRYSEPVDIGDLSATGGRVNVQASRSFASAAEHGGAITKTGGGLTVTGFASVASGSLVTGSRDLAVDVSEVHSLYRSFALTGADAGAGIASVQPHRVRIGIASYVQGTVTRGNTVFHNWIGFIDDSELPAGEVTRSGNDFIVDTAAVNNKLAYAGTANHPLPALSVDSATDELYGEWDCSPPVFAKFAGYDAADRWVNASSECEIIGSGYLPGGSSGTTITQMEFHLFDNTPRYTAADAYQWVSKRGWMRGAADEQVARDISGGARAFASQPGVSLANRTSGGIRASSLENAVSAFSYRSNSPGADASVKTFENSGVGIDQKYYANSVFDAATSPTRSPDSDGLYFAIPLKTADASLFPLRSSFDIMYDSSGSYITDLAGNRMKSAEVTSIDRSPPTFSLTVAPVKTDKLYIVFSKQIRTTAADLAVIPSQLELTDTGGTPVAGFAVKRDVPAELVRQTADGTGLVVTLSRSVTLDDVRTLRVRVKQPVTTTIDPLTGLPDYIPEIFDTKGNSMISRSAHTLSDFAVNVVNVMYAFDGKGRADADSALLGEGTYGSVYDEYNWAVRDFSGSGNNTGRMLTDSDITVAVRVTDGTATGGRENAPTDVAFKLIAAVTYPPDTVSDAYNNHLGDALRVWLPTELSSLASGANRNVQYVGEYAVDADASGLLRNFVIPNASDSAGAFGWTAGQEVQFLFGLYDSGDPLDPLITIDHDADPGTPPVPLYALCLSADRRGVQSSISAEMAATLDLWSFKLADKVRQRGGVTVLNNVINASVREETVVEVDMPSSGNLNVQILTLDGNVVKTLQKGRTASGLQYYRWNGTNNAGSPVARGMYFVRITGSGFDETRKVMVVKD